MVQPLTGLAYDRSRALPLEVSGAITTAITSTIERQGWSDPTLLELGVGTGRIALPIVARGYNLTGLDPDPAMLNVFRQKMRGVSRKVTLIEGDAQELPFERHSFHAAIAVHVWHLIPDLEMALSETIRVLRRGGLVFEGWQHMTTDSPDLEIQTQWLGVVAQLGHPIQRGAQRAALNTSKRYFHSRRYTSEEKAVATWSEHRTPHEVLDLLREGVYSFARNVPAHVRHHASRIVAAELARQYPDPETTIRSEWTFVLRTTQLARQ